MLIDVGAEYTEEIDGEAIRTVLARAAVENHQLSLSGTRRRRQWAGRRDACTPSFAAAVWEIVQISRLRPDRESEVCLPSFLPSTTARLRGVGLR
jgi:hypothetical protein